MARAFSNRRNSTINQNTPPNQISNVPPNRISIVVQTISRKRSKPQFIQNARQALRNIDTNAKPDFSTSQRKNAFTSARQDFIQVLDNLEENENDPNIDPHLLDDDESSNMDDEELDDNDDGDFNTDLQIQVNNISAL